MTRGQQNWASHHDWYIAHHNDDGVVVRHELNEGETRTFTDFKKLQEWAGY